MCYVYIVGESNATTCKIGISWDVPKRISELQVASPARLHIHYLIECQDEDAARFVERLLHDRYAEARAEREWFHKTPKEIASDVEWALSLAASIKTINPTIVAKSRPPRKQHQSRTGLTPSPRQMALEWGRLNKGLLGLTYRQMEEVSGVPRATLQRAIDGDPELKAARELAKRQDG